MEVIELEPGVYKKQGFPQGSPFSPILSNIALEIGGFRNIKGLYAYVDDGIILREKRDFETLELTSEMKLAGIE